MLRYLPRRPPDTQTLQTFPNLSFHPANDITVRKETEENQASEELFPANNIIAQKTQAERTLGQHNDNYNENAFFSLLAFSLIAVSS